MISQEHDVREPAPIETPEASKAVVTAGERDEKNVSMGGAAAEIIHALDSAFVEMNALAATSARDADEARKNARTAAEVARRYGSRAYPIDPSDVSFDVPRSPTLHIRSPLKNPSLDDGTNGKSNGVHLSSSENNLYIKSPTADQKRLADEVLSLSLELERYKHALSAEQIAHDETRNLLAEARSKSEIAEKKLHQFMNSMETHRESRGREVDTLEQELKFAKERVAAAEEDAQLALDLAKSTAEGRDQLESWLDDALAEIAELKGTSPGMEKLKGVLKKESTPRNEMSSVARHVSFADSQQYTYTPPQNGGPSIIDDSSSSASRPSRPLVAAGRNLLYRALAKSNDGDKMHSFAYTPSKSAERRQKLRDHMRDLDVDVNIPSPADVRTPQRNETTFGNSMAEVCKIAVGILEESGRKLDIGNHWKRDLNDSMSRQANFDAVTRKYCQSVEVKLSRQEKEITELRALCGFLEQKLSEESTRDQGSLEQQVSEDS